MNSAQLLDQFSDAMRSAGLSIPSELVADGKLHRFDVEGDKRHSKNGWYVLHADGLPAGEFGCWKRQIKETWCAKADSELSADERTAHRVRIEAMRAAREAETTKTRKAAREKATKLWESASARVKADHPYLVKKLVRAYGLRQLKDQLVIRVCDSAGELHGLQFIGADGEKKFLTGTDKRGHYHALGKPQGVIVIAEGYATGATIYAATGHAVAVAFDAGNLKPVAEALRAKYPDAELVLAADNDHATAGNPGMTRAQEAATAVGGTVAAPEFSGGDPGTDWNDYAAIHRIEAVRSAFSDALQSAPMPAAQVQSPAIKSKAKDKEDRTPRFTCTDKGIWWHGVDKDGEALTPSWVAPPLHVSAYLRDVSGENWGRLLEFNDKDSKPHRWGMPMRLLSGGCEEMRSELLRLGFDVPARMHNRNHLTDYIQQAEPQTRARCVERTGWHERVFVMPERTIGQCDETVLFQSESASAHVFSERGELHTWRTDIADLCRGNSRLLFSVSAAFAAMLVHWAGEESGGFHLRGGSSTGKTTALRVAASVYGGPAYLHRWRATDNALESIAAGHSDTLLILDELAQIEARVAGETAYMLANGEGKQRAQRVGGIRPVLSWRLLFLSAGEVSLSQHMQEGGKRTHAGQDTRLADIPADAGLDHGIFETLHGYANGAALSRAMNEAAKLTHGTAAPAFISALQSRLDDLGKRLHTERSAFIKAHVPSGADGQVQRVAARFALVASGGELATELGITGWDKGEATDGVLKCYQAWLSARGGIGNLEPRQMIQQVRRFLEEHGQSRFPPWTGDTAGNYVVQNRAGFRRGEDSYLGAQALGEAAEVFYVLQECFKNQVCNGLDYRAVCRALADAGCLKRDGASYTRHERLPQMGKTRCYVITPEIFQQGEDNEIASA